MFTQSLCKICPKVIDSGLLYLIGNRQVTRQADNTQEVHILQVYTNWILYLVCMSDLSIKLPLLYLIRVYCILASLVFLSFLFVFLSSVYFWHCSKDSLHVGKLDFFLSWQVRFPVDLLLIRYLKISLLVDRLVL